VRLRPHRRLKVRHSPRSSPAFPDRGAQGQRLSPRRQRGAGPGRGRCRVPRPNGFVIDTITGVDWMAVGEMEVVYDFFHLTAPLHVVVRTRVPRDNPELPTISNVYPGANWHERETHEFFGFVSWAIPIFRHCCCRRTPPITLEKGLSRCCLRRLSRPVHHRGARDVRPEPRAATPGHARRAPGEAHDGRGIHHPRRAGVRLHPSDAREDGREPPYAQFLPNTSRIDYLSAMHYTHAFVGVVERAAGIECRRGPNTSASSPRS